MKTQSMYIMILFIFVSVLEVGKGFCSESTELDIKDFKTERVLKTSFQIPLEFCAELGTFSLLIENSPSEKDIGYIRAHNLESWTTFWTNAYQSLLKDLETINPLKDSSKLSKAEQTALAGIVDEYLKDADNLSVLPIYLQGSFKVIQKYALPNSILSLTWSFYLLPSSNPPANLSMFRTAGQFYSYTHNTFTENIEKLGQALEEKQFGELRSLMYL